MEVSITKITHTSQLILINVTHIFVVQDTYSFISGRNVTKCGRIMERHRQSNLAELKFGLKLFCPSFCHFYSRRHIKEIGERSVSLSRNSSNFDQSSPNLEEYIKAVRGVTKVVSAFATGLL